MLMRVEDGRSRPALLSKAAVEKQVSDIRFEVAPSVPLIARDSFVAETAGKIEQLQATIRLMSRDLNAVAGSVADLKATAEQELRWQNFQKGDPRRSSSRSFCAAAAISRHGSTVSRCAAAATSTPTTASRP